MSERAKVDVLAVLVHAEGMLLTNGIGYDQTVARARATVYELIEALREVEAINAEDSGTFRKRGGTRAGLSLATARAALARIGGAA